MPRAKLPECCGLIRRQLKRRGIYPWTYTPYAMDRRRRATTP